LGWANCQNAIKSGCSYNNANGSCAPTISCNSYLTKASCTTGHCSWQVSTVTSNNTSGSTVTSDNTGGVKVKSATAAQNATPNIAPIKLTNPLGAVTSPQEIIGKIINSVMGIVGSIALLMFIFGGLTWMTSSGKAEQIKKGRDIIVWSAIGLVVMFMAYGLVRLLILTIQQ